MPFVQRVIEPKHLSRTSLADADGKPLVDDYELEAVANNTLCNALRQLASLVLAADDIFRELRRDLEDIAARGDKLKVRIGSLDTKVGAYDPKKVSVPVSDITSFAQLKSHYHIEHPFTTALFERASRPKAIKELYEAAAKTPIHLMRQLDRWRRDGHRSSRFFMCTPILSARRKRIRNKVDIDIETRMPALVEDLRNWTSTEALGDVTMMTDGLRIRRDPSVTGPRVVNGDGDLTDGTILSDDEAIDHKLPSPEEQIHVVALKFPAEIVTVDVSGKCFDRMSGMRRSLMAASGAQDGGGDGTLPEDGSTVRRRTKTRKPRNRRRNTLAGTDQKEIRDALTAAEDPNNSEVQTDSAESPSIGATSVGRSKSSDLLRKRDSSETMKKSHFNTLKQWGKKMIANYTEKSDKSPTSDRSLEDEHQYETVTLKRKRNIDKERKSMHERKASCSSSEKSSINIPINTPLTAAMNIATVKLRDSSAQRRLRRTGGNKDEPHSSSGNWSASSESGRASIGSEITTTTQPKSTTSAATSSNSLNLHPPSSVNSRRRYINTSASGSVTSEGTLTPDIIHDLHEDGETSSVYSCDTEGYYTSFHMDSGLKTLKEEDSPVTPLHSTSTFSSCSANTAENEYELFGKGSTSTTTSSAGTVCTALRAAESDRSLIIGPAVPERKSSLSKLSSKSKSPESSLERDYSSEKTGTVKRSPATTTKSVVVQVHKNNKDSTSDGDVSPDSGHNTSSSPIESINSPNGVRSGSEFEYSESSDMEGADRIERIRVKTTINSSRIPSMCVITPNQSDDDCSVKSNQFEENHINNNVVGSALKGHENNNNVEGIVKKGKIQVININPQTGYATIDTHVEPAVEFEKKASLRSASPSGGTMIVKDMSPATGKSPQPIFKATLLPLNNMLGKLKLNLSAFSSRTSKSPIRAEITSDIPDGDAGEYVTIADVKNNNEKSNNIYANDVVNRNLTTVLSGKIRETEYISLNELPCNEGSDVQTATSDSLERRRKGARVTLNSEGKVIYSSDSLKRRRGAHTTFEPGPFVKAHSPTQSPLPARASNNSTSKVEKKHPNSKRTDDGQPSSTQLGKVVIKASNGTTEIVRMPPSTIVSPNATPMSPTKQFNTSRGAYVNVLNEGRALSPSNQPHAAEARHQPYDYYAYNNQMYGANNLHFENGYNQRPATSMYSTLPSRKPQYASRVLPERSVTPDIMRGLANIEYNSLERKDRRHFDGIQEYQGRRNYAQDEFEGFVEYPPPPTPQRLQQEMQMMQQQHHQQQQQQEFYHPPPPTMNLGIPVQIPQVNMYNLRSPHVPHNYYHFESPKKDYPPDTSFKLSPIDPRMHSLNGGPGGLKTSTPAKVQELKAAANLESRMLSPKKSSMTNEELYAVIHKTKKKMNIQSEDIDRPSPSLSPVSSESSMASNKSFNRPETGYLDKTKSRLSWSPNGDYIDFNTNIDKIPPAESRSRQSWACSADVNTNCNKKDPQTSRLDFKRLLLMHGKPKVQQASKKLSAVEQLKLSKQQLADLPKSKEENDVSILDLSQSPRNMRNRKFAPPGSPNKTEKQRPVPKLLSPRSQWRFANPRTDVLSSTIPEDCQEDENHSRSSLNGDQKESPLKMTHSPNNTAKFSPKLDQSATDSKLPSETVLGFPPKRTDAAASPEEELISFKDIKQKFERELPKLPPMTATQRLQAQRAQFFSNAPKPNTSTNTNLRYVSSFDNKSPTSNVSAQQSVGSKERTPSPTLETSF